MRRGPAASGGLFGDRPREGALRASVRDAEVTSGDYTEALTQAKRFGQEPVAFDTRCPGCRARSVEWNPGFGRDLAEVSHDGRQEGDPRPAPFVRGVSLRVAGD